MNKKRQYYKSKRIADRYYFEKGNFEKALFNYRKGLNYIDDNDSIFKKIADCYFELGKFYFALKYCNIGLKLSIADEGLIELKGNILKSMGEIDEADLYFKKVEDIRNSYKDVDLDLDEFYGTKK